MEILNLNIHIPFYSMKFKFAAILFLYAAVQAKAHDSH